MFPRMWTHLTASASSIVNLRISAAVFDCLDDCFVYDPVDFLAEGHAILMA